MTGIIIDSNSYIINTGNTKIEYASSGDCVGYSMYGEDIPYNDIYGWIDWTHTNADDNGVICLGSGKANTPSTASNTLAKSMYNKNGGGSSYGILSISKGQYGAQYTAVIEFQFPSLMKFESIEMIMRGNGNTVNMHLSTYDENSNSWVDQVVNTISYYSQVTEVFNLNNAESSKFKIWFNNPSYYGTKDIHRIVEIKAKQWGKKI